MCISVKFEIYGIVTEEFVEWLIHWSPALHVPTDELPLIARFDIGIGNSVLNRVP